MRLIDKDLLHKALKNTFKEYTHSILASCVENMPTVEAIPIEWMRQWEKENWEIECNYGIDMMIEEWEKQYESDADN